MAAARPAQAYRFLIAVGGRNVLKGFPANFLAGPFYLDATIKNGAVTATDLTAADAWYADAQVRAAFSPANAGTTKQNFTVHIDSIRILITDGTFSALVATTKEKLWDTAYLSIRAIVGGTTRKYPVDTAIHDMLQGAWAAATSSPATTFGSNVRGVPWVLPSPIRVDCNQDSLDLVSEADAALGADTPCKVELGIGSVVVPNSEEGAGSDAQNESCSAEAANADPNIHRRAYLGSVSVQPSRTF